jgi:hypothetical protein
LEQWSGQASGYAHFNELDVFEACCGGSYVGQSGYYGSVHDWSGIYNNGWPVNISNNATHYFTPVMPSSVNWNQYHTYGALWVPQKGATPGYIQFFFDGYPGPIEYYLGPPVSPPVPQNGLGSYDPTSPSLATTTYSIIDSQHPALNLSTDGGWPMLVDWVRVWQGGTSTPAVSLSASPTSILTGATTTLTWSSTNSTSCAGSGFTTNGAVSATFSAFPTATTTYAVNCSGIGGSAGATTTVGVTPAASINYNFATGLPSGVTVARTSPATYYNASGNLTLASANTPRFDYNPQTLAFNGLLIESTSTNLLPESLFASGWTAGGVTLTTNATTSPDGGTTAATLIENTANSAHNIYEAISKAASNIQYTYTVYAKADGRRLDLEVVDGVSAGIYVPFDLVGGQVGYSVQTFGSGFSGGSASITSVGNGFYRCTLTFTSSATTALDLYLGLDSATGLNNTNTSYTGNGTSGVVIYGAQLEQSSVSSTYIPTVTTSAIRGTDNVEFTIPVGTGHLTYTFDNATMQTVAVSPGAYTVPDNLNREWIQSIVGAP